MADSVWVLNLPLESAADSPILVHAVRRSPDALDLDLIATDGEDAWRYKLRERKTDRLRESSYLGTEQDWLKLLTWVFTADQNVDLPQSVKDSLQPICEKVGSTLRIVIRTRVDEIVQRLGTVDLKHTTDNDDVNIFDWTTSTVNARKLVSTEADRLRAALDEKNDRIDSLTKQLEQLLAAKQEHEDQMLAKFTLLLNEKKARIRSHQKQLIDSVYTDSKAAQNKSMQSRTKARLGKRPAEASQSDDDSDAFESMPLRHGHAQETDVASRSPSRQTTASEDSDLDSTSAVPHQNRSFSVASSGNGNSSPPKKATLGSLPSSKAPVNSQASDATMKDADPDETASEDEEL